jgi:urease accessory protein
MNACYLKSLDDAATHDTGGCARLEVEMVFGESTATTAWASNPLNLLTPCSRGKSVWAVTSSFGGGLVAGDQTRLAARIGPGTRCFLGTQASTKIYRNPARLPCSHTTEAVVESAGLLIFAPDPVQAFADSTYNQRQTFRLEPGAGLVLLDWFTSGRVARGERWDFADFRNRNEVFVENDRVFVDSITLNSDDESLSSAHRTGRFNCFATLVFIGPLLQAQSAALLAEISTQPIARRESLVCSASAVPAGTVLRIAGQSMEAVGLKLHRHLKPLAALLGDDPWERKW